VSVLSQAVTAQWPVSTTEHPQTPLAPVGRGLVLE
jgi:hypothetical protein